jgi:hypothetical protein
MKRTILLLSLAGYIFLHTSCSKQRLTGKAVCEGYIYDTIGGIGVEGIQVSLQACNPRDGRNFCAMFTLGSATTDALGHYKISEKSARSGRYFISGQGIKYQELNENDLDNPTYSTGYLKK